MSDNLFRPFETQIDEAVALAVLRDALSGADDGELFLARRRSEVIMLDDGRIRTASYDAGEGFGMRGVAGEATGYAHASEISEGALRRAAETVRLAVAAGGGRLAPPPQGTNRRLYAADDPLADAAFAAKIETLREIDSFCLFLFCGGAVNPPHKSKKILRGPKSARCGGFGPSALGAVALEAFGGKGRMRL